jgi:hypothetical protein
MDEFEKMSDENLEYCRSLDGPEKCEYITSHLEDYHFALAFISNPKVLRYYRELFIKLVRNFGH